MAQLAILGHATRGKEVIEILEMLGGKIRRDRLAGNEFTFWYYINENGYIDYDHYTLFSDTIGFTLEEFLEKFPYKVGDKVLYKTYGIYSTIKTMKWNAEKEQVFYRIDSKKLFVATVDELKPCKEETMEENTDKALAPDLKGEDYSDRRFGYKIPNGYEFECVRKNEIILKPIKPKYPKTYVECAKTLDCFCATYIGGYKGELLGKLQELLICRDAYWKIAGDWKPGFMYCDLYCIGYDGNVITWKMQGGHRLLAFPIAEMRDVFYENFKELIEECKEFL